MVHGTAIPNHSNAIGSISMIIYSIYKVVNQITGKCYIGMTKEGKKRFSRHITLSKNKPQLLIQKIIQKYNQENFSFEIIFQTKDVEFCKEMETYFITEFKTIVPNGYNIHSGGNYCPVIKRNSCRERMLIDNPGKTEESIKKKTSIIQAVNIITNQTYIVANRKEFAKENNLQYTSIGWAIQKKKPLKNEWLFSYVEKRTMGA